MDMKPILIAALLALLVAGNSLAVIDEDDNVIGLYFDSGADIDCLEAVAGMSQVPCYIVLTNPTFSELHGFELGFDYGSELLYLGTTLAVSDALNVGEGNNIIAGFGSPLSTDEATHLATLNMMYTDTGGNPTTLTLHGSDPTSLDSAYPTVLLADGVLMSTELHDSQMNYQMNGICGFEDQVLEWDGVKSLYR